MSETKTRDPERTRLQADALRAFLAAIEYEYKISGLVATDDYAESILLPSMLRLYKSAAILVLRGHPIEPIMWEVKETLEDRRK